MKPGNEQSTLHQAYCQNLVVSQGSSSNCKPISGTVKVMKIGPKATHNHENRLANHKNPTFVKDIKIQSPQSSEKEKWKQARQIHFFWSKVPVQGTRQTFKMGTRYLTKTVRSPNLDLKVATLVLGKPTPGLQLLVFLMSIKMFKYLWTSGYESIKKHASN